MKSYRYHHLDVFTDQALGGNPLAVYPEPGGLSDHQMQKIAREMNFSETVFCFPSKEEQAEIKLRIFTIDRELPLAGHPVVGALNVLAETKRVAFEGQSRTVFVELGVGVLPVDLIAGEDGKLHSVVMTQQAPEFGETFLDRDELAAALGIPAHSIGPGDLPARVVDTGVPWLIIPIVDLAAMKSLSPDMQKCRVIAKTVGTDMFFAFTQDTEDPSCSVRTRHVWYGSVTPGEDPATGSANGCVGSYLVHEGVLLAAPTAQTFVEQGIEIGRPSKVEVLVDARGRDVLRVRVGGQSVHVGDGELRL